MNLFKSLLKGRSLSLRSLLIFNGSMHAVSQALRTLITLLIIPMMLNYLGKNLFGLWMIALSFIMLIGFVQGGISGSLINIVASAPDDKDELSKTVASAISITSIIALGLTALAAIIAYTVPWVQIFKADGLITANDLSRLVFVLFASFAFSLIALVPKFTLIGYMQAYWAHLSDIFATCVSAVLIILMIQLKQPLWIIALAFSFGRQIPLFLIGLFLLHKQLGLRGVLQFQVNRAIASTMLKAGGLLSIIQAAYALANHADLTLIGIFGDLQGAGDYSILQRIYAIPMVLLSFVSLALWPAFNKAKANGSIDWMKRVFARNLLLLSTFSICFALTLSLLLEWLLNIWLGSRQNIDTYLVWGMAIWVMITVPIGVATEFLKSTDYFKVLATTSLAMVVINVPASIFFIKSYGEAGAIMGTIVANVLCYLIPLAIMVPRVFKTMQRDVSVPSK